MALLAACLLFLQAIGGSMSVGHASAHSRHGVHVHVHALHPPLGEHHHHHHHGHEDPQPSDDEPSCCCDGHDHASLTPLACLPTGCPDLVALPCQSIAVERLPPELAPALHGSRAPPPPEVRPPPGLAALRLTILLI